MNVQVSYPLNTYGKQDIGNSQIANDGTTALGAGIKLYIAAGASPLVDYYGFYSLRMTPFFKATGGNEIDVVVNSARAVRCWFWGSPNGQGFVNVKDNWM